MPDLSTVPADQAQREEALDIRRRVIVQAPAGSGKTDLLTRRYLKLLAVVDEPEQILAITFTRAATAEMRARILKDLDAAAHNRTYPSDHELRISLARAALAQSERRGWNILEHPQRLAIETIDSVCLRIAHDRPLLARLGGHLQPTEEAQPLYASAARRTLEQLGGADAELDAALAHLLDLRDNNLAGCEELLAKMLAQRDQWQHALPAFDRTMTPEDWDDARTLLEAPFHREVRRVLAEAHRLISATPIVSEQLLHLARYACENGNDKVALLAGARELAASMPPTHWQCVCNLLLTEKGTWRKTVTVNDGFPSETKEQKQRRTDMISLLKWLQNSPELLAALCAVRDLPPETYSEAQWTTLRHVLTVLRQAIAQLRVVFAETNSVDFTEISAAALEVLKDAPDRAAGDVRHLLIDEFQDTSRRQHDLVSALLAAWDPSAGDEHRTVFLVGDPMQSIYMFRQAEVELFTHVRDHGIGGPDVPAADRIHCHPVQLSVNFRSHTGLTTPLNEFFRAIDDIPGPPGSAPVRFAEATSADTEPRDSAVHVHPQIVGNGAGSPTREECQEARRVEARDVLNIIRQHVPRIERARAAKAEYRVAILVRNRTHLLEILPLLRESHIPYRAVEIERLTDRQELLDLRSLTRALLHPMDRIAWLSVLRAPWCGLTLADLHILTGSDNRSFRNLPVLDLVERHQHLLSPDGQQRLARTTQILRRALDLRWRQSESPSFASWIERTWRTLGGPACIDAAAYENTQVFFSLLDAVAPDGLAPLTAEFDAELDRLYAQPDPGASDKCGVQLMTIHKAKGLGFEVVIVPGLERKVGGDDKPLICSLERRYPFDSSIDEFLVAPIGQKGEDTDPLYQWVSKQRKIRFDEERKRLFYVASTRARQELHLLGTATLSSAGLKPGASGSLLATAWPALRPEFEVLQQQAAAPASASAKVLAFPTTALAEGGDVADLAAAASAPRPGPHRLPLNFAPARAAANVTVAGANLLGQSAAPEFRRPEGSRQARVLGSAVHALLQRLGPQLATLSLGELSAHTSSVLRGFAMSGDALASATATVTNMLAAAAADPVCQWILAPHPESQSEASWSSFADARLRTLRADRVFRAGPAPLAAGSECLWIVDYKTGPARSGDRAAFLAGERITYAPQLLAYACILRELHGPDTPLRLGLYYPAIPVLDWWDPSGSD